MWVLGIRISHEHNSRKNEGNLESILFNLFYSFAHSYSNIAVKLGHDIKIIFVCLEKMLNLNNGKENESKESSAGLHSVLICHSVSKIFKAVILFKKLSLFHRF